MFAEACFVLLLPTPIILETCIFQPIVARVGDMSMTYLQLLAPSAPRMAPVFENPQVPEVWKEQIKACTCGARETEAVAYCARWPGAAHFNAISCSPDCLH